MALRISNEPYAILLCELGIQCLASYPWDRDFRVGAVRTLCRVIGKIPIPRKNLGSIINSLRRFRAKIVEVNPEERRLMRLFLYALIFDLEDRLPASKSKRAA